MSRLQVTDLGADGPVGRLSFDTTEPAAIGAWLGARGVRFRALGARASTGDALADWADVIGPLRAEQGYATIDVVRLTPDHPDRDAIRAKFLSEHVHEDDEVRLFAEGGGGFFLRFDDVVATVSCAAGDLIWVPAGQRHWFDAGLAPSFVAVRFFRVPEGWVARFTGDGIAADFAAWAP